MKLARATNAVGKTFWVKVDEGAGTARMVRAPFHAWAPWVGGQGDAPLDLHPVPVRLVSLRLCAPVLPAARVFEVEPGDPSPDLRRRARPSYACTSLKPASAIVDPDGQIQYPAVVEQVTFDVQLVAVVARPLGDAPRASSCLLGYTIGSDLDACGTVRTNQIGLMDRTAAVGPWITTIDEFDDPSVPAVEVAMRVNGETRSTCSTDAVALRIDDLLDYVDARIELQPGDLLFTGPVRGRGFDSPRGLCPGDRVEAIVERIGVLRTTIGARRVLAACRNASGRRITA